MSEAILHNLSQRQGEKIDFQYISGLLTRVTAQVMQGKKKKFRQIIWGVIIFRSFFENQFL